jgi:heptosyltransferase-2
MKILVIQKKRIGDVLTSTIILEALKARFPDAELHYLVYENSYAVVKNNKFIDKIVVLDEKSRKGKLAFLAFLLKIRKEKYDIVIDAYGKPNSVILAWFSGAKKTISFEKTYSKLLLTHVVNRNIASESNASKAIEHRMALLKPLGIDFNLIAPKIFLSEEEISIGNQKLLDAKIDISKNILMISALGSQEIKSYPLHYMAEVLDYIVVQKEVQILFNYLPWQQNQAIEIYNLCNETTKNNIFIDFFQEDLREFLAVLFHCKALIGNEGGAANMAKALEIPTFSIYSPGIKKTDWNVFENTTTNISVHYDDYEGDLPNEGDLFEKYSKFKPSYFQEKLHDFLNFNCR